MSIRLAAAMGREPWRADAACLGADPWLFDGENASDRAAAMDYCRRCPVTRQCLDWVRRDRKFVGVAGGRMWNRERRADCPDAGDLSVVPR